MDIIGDSIFFKLILIICIILFIFLFNRGITLKNYVEEAFATMDVYLKKRWDLIPNLLETVKGYVEHEKTTFEKITELRNKNYNNLSDTEKLNINEQIGKGLKNLFALSENYPELKANENFKDLMKQLSLIEDEIANARKYYNGTVRELNNYTEMFPSNIIALIFKIKSAKFFEIEENERQNTKVEL